ncbi:MAG: hypothetical protein JWN40_4365 [Phycisphaerales bacterium]|nr:hypothetical protein [Phycisphaerales bacterium]
MPAHMHRSPYAPAHRPLVVPFRWDITRRERLGRLIDGPPADTYPEFIPDLRTCCARVLNAAGRLAGRAGEADLLFVGRSPESLFDYLRGLCRGTDWFGRLRLFHFSMRGIEDERQLRRQYPAGLSSLRAYLAALGVDPASLLARSRPAVLVDLVSSGGTFANLVRLLRRNCVERGVSWRAARRNLRLIGITSHTAGRSDDVQWHLRDATLDCLQRSALRSVPAPGRLWDYLGNQQPKVAESYPPEQWGREMVGRSFRSADHAPALRLALRLFETGGNKDERRRFIAELSDIGALRQSALRYLASQMRGGGDGGARGSTFMR